MVARSQLRRSGWQLLPSLVYGEELTSPLKIVFQDHR